MPNYNRTAWFIDVDGIRELVRTEIGIRGSNYTEIFEQTGVAASSLGRFLNENQTLVGDALVTLVKWAGSDTNRFIKRRRSVAKHKDSYEQQKLRAAALFLKAKGIAGEPGETPVDTLVRLLATAEENGFLK